MKHLKSYNESLMDKMVSKNSIEVLKSIFSNRNRTVAELASHKDCFYDIAKSLNADYNNSYFITISKLVNVDIKNDTNYTQIVIDKINDIVKGHKSIEFKDNDAIWYSYPECNIAICKKNKSVLGWIFTEDFNI